MGNYSDNWNIDGITGDIHHDEGKFYSIIHGPNGNPVIHQHEGGNVYLTMVGNLILCEEETIYEDGKTPTKQWRAVRASVYNPDQPGFSGVNKYLLGEGHSNTQRIFGPPDKFWLVRLRENPDPDKYALRTRREIAQGKDNFAKVALFMYRNLW